MNWPLLGTPLSWQAQVGIARSSSGISPVETLHTTMTEHTDEVSRVAWSRDGGILAISSRDPADLAVGS